MTASAQAPPGPGAVVVTGASSGIGRACALHLAACGFRVFAGARSGSDRAALAEAGGGRIEPIQLDVTDPAQIGAAARAVDGAVGEDGLAGLVNNAGIAEPGMLEFLPLDALRRQLEVNVTGLVAVTQAFLPLLRRRRARSPDAPVRIVHVGSASGYLASPLVGAYNASKFAVEGLADTMRQELRPWRIDVSLVEPGAIQTPIFEKSDAEAEVHLEKLPEEARALYAPFVEAIRASVARRLRDAKPASTVARAVEHALTAGRPRTRYRVGVDATVQRALARWLPDRARDAVLARFLGLPRRLP
ncbi:MAG TPA: SDR family oxidoreductase [Myxococcota bacterium]|nr:SDR family oxidoreductase [Myxococcota bacterium]